MYIYIYIIINVVNVMAFDLSLFPLSKKHPVSARCIFLEAQASASKFRGCWDVFGILYKPKGKTKKKHITVYNM